MGDASRSANRSRGPRPSSLLRLEPLDARDNPTVLFYGGNVLPHVEAQPVYLGSAWSAHPATRATTDAFLRDVTGGAYMDALTGAGYGVGRGTASTGVVDPVPLSSGSMISDASIQARLRAGIRTGALPAPDANRLYVVYVEPNVAVNLGAGQGTTRQGILGYHDAFAGPNGTTIRYAVVAYPGGAAGNSSLGTSAGDQLTAVTSHELAEAVTDPDVNYGQAGWYDPQQGEIGDITANDPGALVRLDGYLVQEVAGPGDNLLGIPTGPTGGSASGTATRTGLAVGAVSYFGWFATATVTVTVSPATGAVLPGGTVELTCNGRVLGTATVRVVNGVATATFDVTFYANGDYAFAARYAGSGAFQSSASGLTTVAV